MSQSPTETDRRPVAAIFDLDRTVTRRATFTPFIVSAALARPASLLRAPFVLIAALGWRVGLVPRGRLKEIMLGAVLGGAPRAEVDRVAAAFAGRCLEAGLRPGARQAVAEHAARGDRLILATASFDVVAERIARGLGIAEVVATRSSWRDDGRLTGRIDGLNCYGAEKLRRIESDLPGLRDGHEAVVYSDSHADLPLLQWADRAVAVNPSRRLRRWAEAEGREVVDWGRPT